MSEKYFVICGKYEEFVELRRRKCEELSKKGETISFSHFVYVDRPEKLKGYSDPKGFFYGTWRENPHIKDIVITLRVQYRTGQSLPDGVVKVMNEVLLER
jgi:hypothetical protein